MMPRQPPAQRRSRSPDASSFAERMFRLAALVASRQMFHRRTNLDQRIISGVDLVIDFATLGEYGLEPIPADGPRERPGHAPSSRRAAGWEAFATARRGACRARRSTSARA